MSRKRADAAVGVRLVAFSPSVTLVFGTACHPAARSVDGESRKANREHKTPLETEGRNRGTYTRKRSGILDGGAGVGDGSGTRVRHAYATQFPPLSLRMHVHGSHTDARAPRACTPRTFILKHETSSNTLSSIQTRY